MATLNDSKTLTCRVNQEDMDIIEYLISYYNKQNIVMTKTAIIKKLLRDAYDNTKNED